MKLNEKEKDLATRIARECKEEHRKKVEDCMNNKMYNPLYIAFKEVLKRWDKLGTHKDDDFGEVYEAMEVAREVVTRIEELEKKR